jgi:subfamily B ATP-binding cassette protein HlyB/CyaB
LGQLPDSGLAGLALIAGYYRIAADPMQLSHQLALTDRYADAEDIVRGANILKLKSRILRGVTAKRLSGIPYPAILSLKEGGFVVLGIGSSKGRVRLVDAIGRFARDIPIEEARALSSGVVVLITRRLGGAGVDPNTFGFRWFWPSILRYRRPLAHVLVASLFVQLFALATPIFFQLVVDKVLVHKGMSTLIVLVLGMVTLGLFEAILRFLRAYTLSHTTNRIDVELGRRLFHHLFRLPLAYFETRAAGQTVARMRELETIRSFLSGQGLTVLLDLVFTLVFIGVMFIYSTRLTLVVLASIPVYLLIASLIRPLLREQINEKFNRGARSQQFLVESIVGAQTLKAAGVEPMMQAQWEERLAAYVRTSFDAGVTGALGQNLIQYVSKVTTALILFFGAQSVIEGSMSVGELIAFNMIASQVVQPILRLSQLWQDFQQVQVSVSRLGDILNAPPEPVPQNLLILSPPRGAIEFRHVTMRYRPDAADALRNVSVSIAAGEVIGIVGPSGSGKSTLTKLIQRLYSPQAGQVMIDGVDVAQLDPGWLRRQIGVVLQENILFNRTIHENIALGDPAMARVLVMQAAKLAGADEFIAQLPQGYDTMIEERGANLSGGQRASASPSLARSRSIRASSSSTRRRRRSITNESERIIQENMRSIVRGRTVIIIAHRLAAVRPCTRIVGIRNGEIVEVGSHDQLLAREGGLYALVLAVRSGEGAGVNERTAPPAATPPPHPPASRPSNAVSGRDREFLPAALEILETPPPPLPIVLIATICAFALAALAWSYFGRLDVDATARGKIETVGHAKVIEPLDPGKVAAIHVVTGESVKAGDLLLELDPAEASADAASAQDALNASLAEAARRRYAIDAVRAAQAQAAGEESEQGVSASRRDAKDADDSSEAAELSPIEKLAGQPELTIAWDKGLPEPFRLREEAVLRADLVELADSLRV